MSQQGHAFLPPSGAPNWRLCALWPTMNQLYPEVEPSPESLEGTAAHWVWNELWHGRPVSVGQVAPNGTEVDQEMLDSAELFCSVIHTPDPEARAATRTEVTLTGTRIHPTANQGTPDAQRYTRNYLKVWEFKYGHEPVAAYENWQMINQTALVLDNYGVDGLQDQSLTVELTVVQPRSYTREGAVRTWSVVASELRPYFNELRAAADRATRPNPTATPGPEQCEFCPGRHACPALANVAYRAADHAMARAVPLELAPAAAARELTKLTRYYDQLRARISGLQEQTRANIKAGRAVPGWHLEASVGRERWARPIEDVKLLGVLQGVPLEKPQVLTPTQARAAGIPDSVVSAWSERPPGAMKLVQDSDAVIRRIFGK